MIKYLLALFLFTNTALAGYTLTWTPPTENVDGSPLTDLAGYHIWCIPADRTYGNPLVINDPTQFEYVSDWASPEGPWKCKMRSFNTSGVVSADSQEVLWECVDPDGDGNCQSSTTVEIPAPGEPLVVIQCPTCEAGTRSNEFTVTRKGYFTITGPDGVLLTKPDGTDRQVTSKDEAFEYITKDGRDGVFTINPPAYEVEWQ